MILGTDISSTMIEFAKNTFSKEEYRNLDFELISAEEINFDNQFDFVLSFTMLQWAKDHHLIIQSVRKALKSKGIFALTMLMGLPTKLKLAIDEIILNKKWNKYFHNFDSGWNFTKKSTYKKLLISEGFVTKRAQVVKQEDIFLSLLAFRGFIFQWFPYLKPLPTYLKEEFLNHVLKRYVELEPLDELGRLHFKINRLEIVAEKA
jgi:trans-aconitate methyltransferase